MYVIIDCYNQRKNYKNLKDLRKFLKTQGLNPEPNAEKYGIIETIKSQGQCLLFYGSSKFPSGKIIIL